VVGPDYSLVGSALGLSREPTALTTSEGSLLIVNAAYREHFGGTRPPLDLASDDQARQGLQLARSMAWRDGAGCVAGIATAEGISPVEVDNKSFTDQASLGDYLIKKYRVRVGKLKTTDGQTSVGDITSCSTCHR
jgi:two-component system cell cycle sensor histidine kinase/response regulator CckA